MEEPKIAAWPDAIEVRVVQGSIAVGPQRTYIVENVNELLSEGWHIMTMTVNPTNGWENWVLARFQQPSGGEPPPCNGRHDWTVQRVTVCADCGVLRNPKPLSSSQRDEKPSQNHNIAPVGPAATGNEIEAT